MIKLFGVKWGDVTASERTTRLKDLWNKLIEREIPLEASHYNNFIAVFNENEQPLDTDIILKEMSSKVVEPNIATYEHLFANDCLQGNLQKAGQALQNLRNLKGEVSEGIYTYLAFAYILNGKESEYLKIDRVNKDDLRRIVGNIVGLVFDKILSLADIPGRNIANMIYYIAKGKFFGCEQVLNHLLGCLMTLYVHY